ncbi:MAG: hypothetical protein ABW186_04355 [Rhodanobacteraceae bacterium]
MNRWIAVGCIALGSAILAGVGVLSWREPPNVVQLPPRPGALAAAHHRPGPYEAPPFDPAQWPRPDVLSVTADESLRSIWLDREKERYTSVLRGGHCDTLVVPVQSQRYAFDRVTRSLMTAELASRLAIDDAHCVVDPYLAARALGEGVRRYEEYPVRDFAKAIGAKRIVWTFAGHDDHMHMDLFMRVETPEAIGGSELFRSRTSKSWADVPFTDERPPFVAWLDLLPDALSALELDGHAPAKDTAAAAPFELPATPEDLVATPHVSALDDARRFELLASLAPAPESRAMERLFEKAWLAADAAVDSPESRRVRARALLHLGYRPAAIAVLGDDASADGKLLRALLDGNLPEAEQARAELTGAYEQLLGAIEVNDLLNAYGRPPNAALRRIVDDQAARSRAWNALLGARAGEADAPQVADNRGLKGVLEAAYPVQDFAYDDIVRGAAVVGGVPGRAELQLSPLRHIDRLIERNGAGYCDVKLDLKPQKCDLLDLVAGVATDNLEREVSRLSHRLGLREDALTYLDALDAEFAGHPHFAAWRASIQTALIIDVKDGRAPEREQLMRAAARIAAFGEQGNTSIAATALIATGIPSPTSTPFIVAYQHDFPARPYWNAWGSSGKAESIEYSMSALRYSTVDPSPLNLLAYNVAPADRAALLDELEHRFHGAPLPQGLRSRLAGNDAADDIDALRKRIADDPSNWDPYRPLAHKLVERGDYDGVVSLVTSYPGFQPNSGSDTVLLSNLAAEMGSLLFWQGQFDQARQLYALSAKYRTGSDLELVAEERLKLLDGRYSEAAGIASSRVARYASPFAIADYLSLLFAYGFQKDGWAAFSRLAPQYDHPEIWRAARVGKRIEGVSTDDFATWLASDGIRAIRFDETPVALHQGMLWFLVDRAPWDGLPELLEKIEGAPPRTFVEHTPMLDIMRRKADGSGTIIRESEFGKERHKRTADEEVPSEYILFARAYDLLRKGDYAGSVAAFDRMSGYYSIDDEIGPNAMSALPYFAYAAARSGDTLGLQPYIAARVAANAGLQTAGQNFQRHLALAYFAGIGGDAARATRELDLTRANIDSRTADGPTFLAYEYAEACIWLFEATNDVRYRARALDWARKVQRMDPTAAWAFALEARYGDAKSPGHTRAVASAWYLDRNSNWLSGVPKPDIEKGRAWLKSHPPFEKPKRDASI